MKIVDHEAVKKTDIAGRIVGGDLAVPHQFPFMVAIFTTKPLLTVLCGGSVIGPVRILFISF